jgi:hypothetical protein
MIVWHLVSIQIARTMVSTREITARSMNSDKLPGNEAIIPVIKGFYRGQ